MQSLRVAEPWHRSRLCAVRDAWLDDKKLSYEILWLPLSEDDNRISMIVSGIGPV